MSTNQHSSKINKIFHSVKVHKQDSSDYVYLQPVDIADIKFSARSSDHSGWLKCDGRAISRTQYTELFNAIGTAFGSGDGSTTFNLPDCRGRVLGAIGTGTGLTARSLGQIVGAETHTLTTSEMPSHSHTITDPGHTHGYVNNTNDQNTDNAFGTETAADQADLSANTNIGYTNISINNTGGGGAHNNMQPTSFIGNVFIFGTYIHVH